MKCCCKSSTKTGTINKKSKQEENIEKKKSVNYDNLPIETRTLNDGSIYVGTTLVSLHTTHIYAYSM